MVKCSDEIFHMTFVVCFSAAKYVAPSLFIVHGKRSSRDSLKGCDIEYANITTAPKGFINPNLFLIWPEIFSDSVPDSVARSFVLVYDGCCSHYKDKMIKKS